MDAIEEPVKVKTEIDMLRMSIANVQQVLVAQNAAIQKEVVATEMYRAELDEFVSWLVLAEIEADTSATQPSTAEEIAALLQNANVCILIELPAGEGDEMELRELHDSSFVFFSGIQGKVRGKRDSAGEVGVNRGRKSFSARSGNLFAASERDQGERGQ